jgi:hypothetical protein
MSVKVPKMPKEWDAVAVMNALRQLESAINRLTARVDSLEKKGG